MAGKYGSASVTVTLDSTAGGSGQAITNHVLSMGGAKITSAMEASHAFGDSWEESTPVGLKKAEPITLEGHWDTTATTGPHAVLSDPDDDPADGTRTLVVVFGDSKTFTVETRLMSYEVLAQVGNITRFRAELIPTGAAVWS